MPRSVGELSRLASISELGMLATTGRMVLEGAASILRGVVT